MSCQEEFATVNLIRNSTADTRGVDSFTLALVKAERQMRKLVTHLVFQSPCFSESDIPDLIKALADNQSVYFEGLNNGFDAIFPKSIRELVGDSYDKLFAQIKESIAHRNKIFHGQLTGKALTREELFAYVDGIEEWCRLLSEAAEFEIGYRGFTDSFQKSSREELSKVLKVTFNSIQDYETFITEKLQRSRKSRCCKQNTEANK
jgi:hypothetical protein